MSGANKERTMRKIILVAIMAAVSFLSCRVEFFPPAKPQPLCQPVGQTRPCYTGPAGTENRGICRAGTQRCESDGWTACTGETLPHAEIPDNGLDDDCDGLIDEGAPCRVENRRLCYTGPAGTTSRGPCQGGVQRCITETDALGAKRDVWSSVCEGEITPQPELCGDGVDNNCNGQLDDGCPKKPSP